MFKARARPQPRIWPGHGVFFQHGVFQVRKRAHPGLGADAGIADAAEGFYFRLLGNAAGAQNFARPVNARPGRNAGLRSYTHAVRRVDEHARLQPGLHNVRAQDIFRAYQFLRVVYAQEACVIAALHAHHVHIGLRGQGDQVGNVKFAAVVFVVQERQQGANAFQLKAIDAGVDLVGFRTVKGDIVVFGLNDVVDLAVNAQHPAVVFRVGQGKGNEGQGRFAALGGV